MFIGRACGPQGLTADPRHAQTREETPHRAGRWPGGSRIRILPPIGSAPLIYGRFWDILCTQVAISTPEPVWFFRKKSGKI